MNAQSLDRTLIDRQGSPLWPSIDSPPTLRKLGRPTTKSTSNIYIHNCATKHPQQQQHTHHTGVAQGAVLATSERGGMRIQFSKNPYNRRRVRRDAVVRSRLRGCGMGCSCAVAEWYARAGMNGCICIVHSTQPAHVHVTRAASCTMDRGGKQVLPPLLLHTPVRLYHIRNSPSEGGRRPPAPAPFPSPPWPRAVLCYFRRSSGALHPTGQPPLPHMMPHHRTHAQVAPRHRGLPPRNHGRIRRGAGPLLRPPVRARAASRSRRQQRGRPSSSSSSSSGRGSSGRPMAAPGPPPVPAAAAPAAHAAAAAAAAAASLLTVLLRQRLQHMPLLPS